MKSMYHMIGLIVIALLVTTCGSPSTPKVTQLKTGFVLWPGYYPLFVAQKQIFTEHGLQVEHKIYQDTSQVLKDLQSGELNMGLVTISDALTLESRNPGEFKIVLGTDYSNGSDAIIADPQIKSIADLRGKRIGLGIATFGELLVRKMLESQQMTVNDVILINTDAAKVADSIPTLIDAGQTYDPYITAGIAKGNWVIFSSADTPGLIADVAVLHKDFLKKNPEAIQNFIQSWFEALAYWQTHPAEGDEFVAKAIGFEVRDISTDGVKLLNLEDNLQAFTEDTGTLSLYGSGKMNSDFLITAGVVNHVPEIKLMLDSSFLVKN